MRTTPWPILIIVLSSAFSGCHGDSPRNRLRLADAAREGDRSLVFSLLGGGVNPDSVDEQGSSALGWAAGHCDKEMVAAFLQRGANPGFSFERHSPAMVMLAGFHSGGQVWCSDGPAIGEMLLRAGADVNGVPGNCWTPLHRSFSPGAVEFLVSHRADLNPCEGKSPVASSLTMAPQALDSYLKAGGNPNARDANGKTALHAVTDKRNGDREAEAIGILLKHNADPNLSDKYGFTPLDYAVRENFSAAVRLLKDRGAKSGTEIKQDPAVYAAQEARAERILEDGGHNCRHQCRFEVTGDDMATGGTESSWAIIQGTSAVVTARCRESGYLHYAVRTSNVKGRMPRQINLPVSAGQTSLPMRFADEWRNGHMMWFFSSKPIDGLTLAVEQNQATCAASIDVTVAPLNGRVIGQGRKR